MDSPATKRRLGRPFTSWSHNFPRNRLDNARHRSWSPKAIPAGSAALGKLSTFDGFCIPASLKEENFCCGFGPVISLLGRQEATKGSLPRPRLLEFSQLLSSELTRRRFSVTLPNRFENPQRMRQFLQLRELFRITFLF